MHMESLGDMTTPESVDAAESNHSRVFEAQGGTPIRELLREAESFEGRKRKAASRHADGRARMVNFNDDVGTDVDDDRCDDEYSNAPERDRSGYVARWRAIGRRPRGVLPTKFAGMRGADFVRCVRAYATRMILIFVVLCVSNVPQVRQALYRVLGLAEHNAAARTVALAAPTAAVLAALC